MAKVIEYLGVGHHPFSKKYEFKGYFDEPSPCLIATDYKAPKTILELHYEGNEEVNKTEYKGVMRLTTTEKVPFKYVELFAGIGGFRQALDKIGGECVFASEIDKFASQAYNVLYGNKAHLHGDITKIDEKDIPDHDVLVGGFPCQAFSVAGKRLGFEDTRGTLFFEVARIMREKKPKLALLENVKGLVGHDKGKTLDTIVQTLNDIGYTVDFNVLNSKYFGVPQNRERIFIIAIRDDLVTTEPYETSSRKDVVARGKKRISELAGVKTFNFGRPEQNEVTSRLRDILEDSVDERYYLSEEKTAKLVAQLGDDYEMPTQTDGINKTDDCSYCITTRTSANYDYRGAIQKKQATMIAEEQEIRPVLTPDRVEKRQNGRRFREDGDESFTLTAQDRHGVAIGYGEVRATALQNANMRGRRIKESDEPSFTVSATDRHDVAIGEKPRYRIRKLTPLECFRLQGFSDEDHAKLVDAGISNSQRYKMAGNAVTVNVIDALGTKLLRYLT